MADIKAFLSALDAPSAEFTPIPFWFLNAPLDAGEIRRQLEDFKAHGVHAVVLHPRMGMDPAVGYLSGAFFAGIRAAIQAADALDMRVVLYDEGMYPSGSASGRVVKGHPQLASRGIALTDALEPGDRLLCRTERGMLVERFSGGTIRGVHYGEDDGEPGAPLSADLLNPEAVERFIRLTHEAYYRRFANYFGRVIIAMFTDEPCILGRNPKPGLQPWTRGFARVFTEAGGHLEGLTALFDGGENDDTRLYHRLLTRRWSEVYYGRLYRWCEAHGIALMGHPERSDDIEALRWFHIPGQDLVYRWVSPETGGTRGMDSVMAKCSADMARLMGRRRNANECLGACGRRDAPWHLPGEDMKWFIDYLAVRGVNLFVPHAFYYSLEGARSSERPPDVGPGSAVWPRFRLWADYMARLSWLMTDARLHADVAVLCHDRALMPEAVAPLFHTQRGFQYIPESFWDECRQEEGALLCRGRRYAAALGGDGRFEGLNRDVMAVPPDILCTPAQSDLRAARFTRGGVECFLLVNEGEGDIACEVTLPIREDVAAYDLWTGRALRVNAEAVGEGRKLALRLHRRASLLLFGCPAANQDEAWPEYLGQETVLAPEFREVRRDESAARVEYEAELFVEDEAQLTALKDAPVVLSVDAEEMAELWVNGAFCGAGLWAPQRFYVEAGALRVGRNALCLRVTGSAANFHGTPVPYGLRQAAPSTPET